MWWIQLALAQPSFEGNWVLDTKRSEAVEPLLKAHGVSWIERKIARSVVPELTVTRLENGWRFATESSVGARTDEVVLDGKPYPAESREGRVECRSTAQADTLHTRCTSGKGTTVVTRSVEQGLMHQRVRFEPDEGEPLEVLRVFRRR